MRWQGIESFKEVNQTLTAIPCWNFQKKTKQINSKCCKLWENVYNNNSFFFSWLVLLLLSALNFNRMGFDGCVPGDRVARCLMPWIIIYLFIFSFYFDGPLVNGKRKRKPGPRLRPCFFYFLLLFIVFSSFWIWRKQGGRRRKEKNSLLAFSATWIFHRFKVCVCLKAPHLIRLNKFFFFF